MESHPGWAAEACSAREACSTSLLALARDFMETTWTFTFITIRTQFLDTAATVVRLDCCRHLMSSFMRTLLLDYCRSVLRLDDTTLL